MAKRKPKPSYAPVYAAAMYPELATLAKKCGYALAVHGSLQRDFDLIAIPWIDKPKPPEKLIAAIAKYFALSQIGTVTQKPHGRTAYTLSIGFGHCALDLQFMPTLDR